MKQVEELQEQLRSLKAEETGINSIMVELRSQSRKLNLEKYRLLELCKTKQAEHEQETLKSED